MYQEGEEFENHSSFRREEEGERGRNQNSFPIPFISKSFQNSIIIHDMRKSGWRKRGRNSCDKILVIRRRLLGLEKRIENERRRKWGWICLRIRLMMISGGEGKGKWFFFLLDPSFQIKTNIFRYQNFLHLPLPFFLTLKLHSTYFISSKKQRKESRCTSRLSCLTLSEFDMRCNWIKVKDQLFVVPLFERKRSEEKNEWDRKRERGLDHGSRMEKVGTRQEKSNFFLPACLESKINLSLSLSSFRSDQACCSNPSFLCYSFHPWFRESMKKKRFSSLFLHTMFGFNDETWLPKHLL